MPPARWVRTLALGLLALPSSAAAQSQVEEWMNPTLGELKPHSEYKLVYYPDAHVHAQRTDLRWVEHSFNLFVPLYQDASNEWTFTGDVSFKDLDTHARLDDTHERLPTELWNVEISGSYRHKFDNGWIGALGATVNSPTDRPFASKDEVVPSGIGMLRVPHGERNAWIFTLIYVRFQEFVGGLPVPGLAYQYVPSDRFNAVIGVPYTSFEYKPIEKLTLEAQYFPLRRARSRITYELFRPLRVFVGFDLDNDQYFLADRLFKKERLFYYENRAMAGARFDLRHVGFQVRGGYAFNRFYFEGDDYSDRRHTRIDVDPGPYVSAGVAVRF
jgi:hypothetical protein